MSRLTHVVNFQQPGWSLAVRSVLKTVGIWIVIVNGHRGKELLYWFLAYPDQAALWAIQIECYVNRNAHQQDEADRTNNVRTGIDALLTTNQQRGDDRAGIKKEHDARRQAVPVGGEP